MKRLSRLLAHVLAAAVLVTGAAALTGCNGANDNALSQVTDGPRGFMIKTLTRGDRVRKYGLFVPTTYSANRKYPVIVFLHGVGEGGNDARSNLRVGLAPFVAAQTANFPFICIFPQSESGNWDANSAAATDVIACLDAVSKQYSVDQDCVCLTGLSTGGYGTWAIGAKYKDRFAALAPMASNGGVDKFASELVGMPIRAYCNAGDMFGGMGLNDRAGVEKIRSLGGTKAEFTETHDGGHNCWEGVYGSGELFAWLQQQRRHGTRAAAPAAAPATFVKAPAAPAAPAVAPVTAVSPAGPARTTSGSSALVPTPY
jgi:poly(3-hydroxybutyrate) depolymerase